MEGGESFRLISDFSLSLWLSESPVGDSKFSLSRDHQMGIWSNLFDVNDTFDLKEKHTHHHFPFSCMRFFWTKHGWIMFVSFCIMFGFGGGIVIEQGQAYFLLNLTSSSSSNHKKSETEDGVSSGYVSLETLDSKENTNFPWLAKVCLFLYVFFWSSLLRDRETVAVGLLRI